MKLLFIIPPSPKNKKIIRLIDCGHETKANYLWQPTDYMNISSLLNEDDNCSLVDGTVDSLNEHEFYEQIKNQSKADILFFSIAGTSWNNDIEYFDKIIRMLPDIPIYVLGDIFIEKEYREVIFKKCDGIITIPLLVELEKMANIRQEKHKSIAGVVLNAEDDYFVKKRVTLGVNQIPRHEVFQKKGYAFPFCHQKKFATVTVSWGCPFMCTYCTDALLPVVSRPLDSITAELDSLKKMGIKELFFFDKSFGFPRPLVMSLLDYMIENHNFSWSCYTQPQLYDPIFFEKMKKAGCHTIIIGIDTYNLESLKKYHRNVKRKVLEKLISKCDELKINICADFIFGLEDEDKDDMKKTIQYALDLSLDYASFNIATPVPGSSIREAAKEKGILHSDGLGFDSSGKKQILGNNLVSSQDILRIQKTAILKFYLRPSYLLRRLKRLTSFEHFLIQFDQMVHLFKRS